jgi:hypothetical protein
MFLPCYYSIAWNEVQRYLFRNKYHRRMVTNEFNHTVFLTYQLKKTIHLFSFTKDLVLIMQFYLTNLVAKIMPQ